MSLLRRELGAVLRRRREEQHRTLRSVAADAGVSLGYLSEVERGVKEASSELLAAICGALGAALPDVLVDVADAMFLAEAGGRVPAGFVPASLVRVPVPALAPEVPDAPHAPDVPAAVAPAAPAAVAPAGPRAVAA